MKKIVFITLYICSVFVGMLEGVELTEGMGNLLDSVVRLDVWSSSYGSGRKKLEQGQGSGVIMSKDGYILTNAHVAGKTTERVRVTLANKERVKAEFVGWDHWTDLALLKLDMGEVERKGMNFSHAKFRQGEGVEMGDEVYAVGTPHGLTRSMTKGIISNAQRSIGKRRLPDGHETGGFNNWYQTDAAINPGNSGGPLVDKDGNVVGINTLVFGSSSNLGFAVPVGIAKFVYEEIKGRGEVIRSSIGIEGKAMQDLEDNDDGMVRGFLVQSVDPGSPAKQGGLRPGDIIESISGEEVDGRFPEQIPPIMDAIAKREIGEELRLKVKRGKKSMDILVTTERLESRVGEKYAFEEWGLTLEVLTKAVAREKKLEEVNGFVVIGVEEGYPGRVSGLRRGDVIKKYNGDELVSMKVLKELYASYKADHKEVFMEVMRGDSIVYLVMKK